MKLVEFLAKLESHQSENDTRENKIITETGLILNSKTLSTFENSLFECDEFKNVIRINYLEYPTYLVDKESGEPISGNREFLGGEVKSHETLTFRALPGQEFKFAKYVDIYTIALHKRYNTAEDVKKPGIWVYPTTFDEKTLTPTNQIRVIWDPEQLNDALLLMGNRETPKERIMRMFESALDNMEPNISCEYVVEIKCSERSIISAEKKEELFNNNVDHTAIMDGDSESK